MLVQVEDGRALRVAGDPDHPVTRGFLCAKVNRYPERTHHPDRITTPLRRAGAKGEGKWQAATWGEAITDISRRLSGVIERDGPEAILPYSYGGTMGLVQGGSMDRRFFHRIGASLLARTICSVAGEEAWRVTYGSKLGPSPEEIGHARLIVLWGTNTLTSNPHLWPAVRRAREGGARVIAIDPVRTRTAKQADLHLAIRPGSDAALALGVMHVISRQGLEDAGYLARHAVGWPELKERLAEWPPARAAEITGVAAATIERLALEYASAQPSFIRLNYGMQRHRGGGMAVRAVALLPAITGAWRYPGGGATLSTSGSFGFNQTRLRRPDWIPAGTRTVNMVRLGEALTSPDAGVGGPPVGALVVYNSNPASVAPELGRVHEGLLREDLFTVVLEHFQTDTARYADWLLPATTQLEHWDLHGSYGHHYVTLNRPAIEPVGKALPNSEIFRRLAGGMGLGDPDFSDTDLELIRQALDTDDPRLRGITLERLLRDGWRRLALPEEYAPFADPVSFDTPSGKVQILAPELAQLGLDPLPHYLPPAEGPPTNGAGNGKPLFPLTLLSPPEHELLNSSFANLEALRRKAGPPRLLLHPDDAGERGIESGDLVRAWNDRGEFKASAKVTDDTRPGVAVCHGLRWSRDYQDGGSINHTTSQAGTDLGGGGTFYDNAVEVEGWKG